MANKKITDIDTITSINDTDKIVVTETDTSVKRISYANLMKSVNDKIDSNTSQVNEIAKPSLLINGGFLINQRKQTQYNKNYKYTVDRWLLSNMNSDEHTEQGVLNVGDGYVELTGMGDKQLMITQPSVEHTSYLQNKTVTFSIEARVENMTQGDIFVQISCKTTSNFVVKRVFNNTEVGNEWKRISVTATLPNTKIEQFWFQCGSFNDPDGGYHPINSDCKIQFRNAKLEVGDKETPFIPRLYGEELSLCQRYYRVLETGELIGQFYTAHACRIWANLNPPMRITPTITFPIADNNVYIDAIGSGNKTGGTVEIRSETSSTCVHFDVTNITDVSGLYQQARYVHSIELDSELR